MAVDRDHADLQPGDILAGKYRVERVLGAGGMGIVVAAHHIQLDERVALKFLLPQAVRSAETLARFVREARAAVKIKSEHVARVTDVGELENGSPYMVMEYLDGRDLAAWLQERGAMPIEQAVDFVLQTCEALADAHTLGIVHRDLKPANLFCVQRSDGELSIKVLDFGISKITTPGAPGHDMTRTSALMGSPLYMSPEQMKHTKGVDARTDIWSLGVILFELVTGSRPFDAEAVTELAIKVTLEPAPPLSAFRGDVPAGLEPVVARCLEKDRAKRFQTVGELAIALKEFGSKNARVSVERVLGILRTAGMSQDVLPASEHFKVAAPASLPQTAAAWGQTTAGTRSRGKVAVGIGVVMVVGVLAAAGGLLLHKSGTAPAAAGGSPTPSAPAASESAAAPARAPSTGDAPVTPTIAVSALPTVSPPAAVAKPATRPAPPPARSAAEVAPAPAPPVPVRPPPIATSVAAPAAKPNCNPPYVIDAAGDRKYKPECL